MKKQMTARRIIVYLCCLSIVGLFAVGGTYARYTQDVQGQATGSVAAVALGGTLDLTSKLEGMRPGDSKTIGFTVSNKNDATVSEVVLNYSVSVETTGNLPLAYTLAPKSGGEAGTYVESNASGRKWTGGALSLGDSDVTHTYLLTVTWPADKADESLADEIDLVTLTVDAQQAEPEPTS